MDRRAELEAAIEEDPYDPRPYAVLGDHLQEIGDPRGQLIALQLAPRKGAMEHAAAAFFAEHPFGLPAGVEARWAFGFARRIALPAPTPELLAATLDHPSARFVVELALSLRDPNAGLEAEVGVLARRRLPCLRSLELATGTGSRLAWLGDVGPLWTAMPRLRRLELIGGCHIRTPFALPELEDLAIGSFRMAVDTTHALAVGSWPALTRLSLRPGACSDETLAGLRVALTPARFPRVGVLEFRDTSTLDHVASWIGATPLLAQLSELALVGGSLTDDGIDALVSSVRGKQLSAIDVTGNAVSRDAIARLATIAAHVVSSSGDLTDDDDNDPDLYDY